MKNSCSRCVSGIKDVSCISGIKGEESCAIVLFACDKREFCAIQVEQLLLSEPDNEEFADIYRSLAEVGLPNVQSVQENAVGGSSKLSVGTRR